MSTRTFFLIKTDQVKLVDSDPASLSLPPSLLHCTMCRLVCSSSWQTCLWHNTSCMPPQTAFLLWPIITTRWTSHTCLTHTVSLCTDSPIPKRVHCSCYMLLTARLRHYYVLLKLPLRHYSRPPLRRRCFGNSVKTWMSLPPLSAPLHTRCVSSLLTWIHTSYGTMSPVLWASTMFPCILCSKDTSTFLSMTRPHRPSRRIPGTMYPHCNTLSNCGSGVGHRKLIQCCTMCHC